MKLNAKYKITRLLISLLALILVALPARTLTMAGSPVGTIAYVRPHGPNGDEIHLVEPDGSADRILFQTNNILPENLSDILSLAWKPNASELAFSSAHEYTCSMYETDIYTIRPNGKNYRRITDAPACGSRAGLPTGTVTVPVYNDSNTQGPFVIYVEGAPAGKSIVLVPGNTMDVTFTNVADYGSQEQTAVWMYIDVRSAYPGAHVDVIPGATVRTGTLQIVNGFSNWGFRWPAYLPDGSKIATIFSQYTLYEFDPNGQALGWSADEIAFDFGLWGSSLVWSPAPEFADSFLYYGAVEDNVRVLRESVFLGNANDAQGQEVFEVDPNDEGNSLLGLAWLPDGSGFLYSLKQFIYPDENTWFQGANLWEYSFETGVSTQLTNVSEGFTRQMTVSPDGSKILFEYQATGEWMYPDQIDLYMMNRDGSNITLFAENARYPAWSLQDIPEFKYIFLPAVRK